ncbi:PEP-CTERM sorting domain-containing protein [Paucibacter sp. APW11]|uniref:PEP-CTERM sorting domain-containing protein n=1 Tax=Roseateles aquae TaxID=3077235 RepID=A0ABU3PE09_9BURK|nr:PEP-CTERM sorting domain-containing protein [Paucibacter sp. APW11]MDT9000814.1 PEP-CTERM sorting domain-containing protein [Paucibacter sp. APW11]
MQVVKRQSFKPRRLALAMAQAALLALVCSPGQATVQLSGPYWLDPGNPAPIGPGDVNLPGSLLYVGAGGNGSFEVLAGSQVSLAGLRVAAGGGSGDVKIDGSGSRLELHAGGNDFRLEIGHYGVGTLLVSNGGTLDSTVDLAACAQGWRNCGTIISNTAGSSGSLTVSGAGSQALLAGWFNVGARYAQPGFGTPGQDSHGNVQVLQGALLSTGSASIGASWTGPSSTGTERSFANVVIDGVGTRWNISGNAFNDPQAHLHIGAGVRSTATLQLANGAQLNVVDGGFSSIGEIGAEGRMQMNSGSMADFGMAGALSVGNGGVGVLELNDAQLHAGLLRVGDNGSGKGTVLLGQNARLTLDGVGNGRLALGQNGVGLMEIRQGGQLLADGSSAACVNQWCGNQIGNAAGSDGRLLIDGAGSQASFVGGLEVAWINVARPPLEPWTFGQPGGQTRGHITIDHGGLLRTDRLALAGGLPSPSGTGGETAYAYLTVQGAGSRLELIGGPTSHGNAVLSSGARAGNVSFVNILDGAQLLLQSAPSADTTFALDWGGGQSQVLVDGLGSGLTLTGGAHSFLGVAHGGGNSQLTLSHGASLAMSGDWRGATIGGRGGPAFDQLGQGTMQVLSGAQWTGAQQISVGTQGAQGSLLLSDAGSRLALSTVSGDPNSGRLEIGPDGQGSLAVSNGALVQANRLQIGSGNLSGWGTASISGSQGGQASRVELSAVDFHRLGLEQGQLTISNGGVLDATLDASTCLTHWCGTFIANNAGADARLTITGAGSRASFLDTFYVGGSYVSAPPLGSYIAGEPGGSTRVDLRVLNGGRLETESVRMGNSGNGPAADGSERVSVNVLLDGPGSVWHVQGGAGTKAQVAGFSTGLNTGGAGAVQNVQVGITVRNGAQLQFSSDANSSNQLVLARDGGQSSMLVTGAGSALSFADAGSSAIWIGRNAGMASLSVANGAQLLGINLVQMGTQGGFGQFKLDGAATRAIFGPEFASLQVGRSGGVGSASISNGAQLLMSSALQNYVVIGEGVDGSGRAAQGALRLDGAGSLIDMHTVASPDYGINPLVLVGQNGFGSLSISNGAKLHMQGDRVPNADEALFTWMTVGNGPSSAAAGTLQLSGLGSEIRQDGFNAGLAVGRYANGSGSMTVSNGAQFIGTAVMVGRDGGRGTIKLDAASMQLGGQWLPGATNIAIGAGVALGSGAGGTGSLSLDHGASLVISNAGSEGAHLVLGGNFVQNQGSGLLDVAGGSSIALNAGPGAAMVVIGHDGQGLATFRGASQLQLGDGSLLIARDAAGIGQLRLSEGSSAQAGYVGVGAWNGSDTGVATLIVNDGSVLTAQTIEVGGHGYVGGTGTLIGNVINRGVFSPGNSPGTLHIQGSFQNQAGGRLVLEVQSDGHGGFVTDQLLFANGASVSLDQLQLSFHFLGNTDPNAFQASGLFGVNTFLQQGGHGLDASLFNQVSYTASADAYQISNFSFNASTGAVFSAQPVPEPATWAMLMMGMLVMGWRRRAMRGGRN